MPSKYQNKQPLTKAKCGERCTVHLKNQKLLYVRSPSTSISRTTPTALQSSAWSRHVVHGSEFAGQVDIEAWKKVTKGSLCKTSAVASGPKSKPDCGSYYLTTKEEESSTLFIVHKGQIREAKKV